MCFRTYPEHCVDTHQRQNNAMGIAALNAILRSGMIRAGWAEVFERCRDGQRRCRGKRRTLSGEQRYQGASTSRVALYTARRSVTGFFTPSLVFSSASSQYMPGVGQVTLSTPLASVVRFSSSVASR